MVQVGSQGSDRHADILGDLEKTLAGPAEARDHLIAAAELLHAFSFDEVSECNEPLAHEPRCSTSCAECWTIWVGSKAGEIRGLQLTPSGLVSTRALVDAGVRTLLHVHELELLVAGLDTGHILVLEVEQLSDLGVRHLATSPASGDEPLPYESRPPVLDSTDPDRFLWGITALIALPFYAPLAPDAIDIVVATRAPALLVVRLRTRTLQILARRELPGWSRCLTITGAPGHEVLVCATRSGEFLQWSCRALVDTLADPVRHVSTSLLPAAVASPSDPMRRAEAVILIGASDGLYVRGAGDTMPVHVAVTHSAVLSIATVLLPTGRKVPGASGHEVDESRHYVALGLEDGRLRVIEENALFGDLSGRDTLEAHDFRVDLGEAVLAVEIMAAAESTAKFVLVALRDHTLKLFHVRSRDALLNKLEPLWREVIKEPKTISASDVATLVETVQALRQTCEGTKREQALRYVLVDQALPRWAQSLANGNPLLIERACALTRGADDKILYRLSATMGKIAHGDAGSLIRLSMACLVAMPQRDLQRWRAFVAHHLKQFHACARDIKTGHDVSRLQYWGRFVRKYLLLGDTFADKRKIDQLVARNLETGKYLDALIYATQLERQRYDLMWSTVVVDEHRRPQDIARVDLLDDVAIVVTGSADVVFYDVNDERKPLPILGRDGHRLHRLSAERGVDKRSGATPRGPIRTRAARCGRNKLGTSLHIAVSWDGVHCLAPGQLCVTVFEVELLPGYVKLIGTHVAEHAPDPRSSAHGTTEVHGIAELSRADAFLVGLDSIEAPLALLKLRIKAGGDQAWVLSPLDLPRRVGSPAAPRASLSTPVRAVAAYPLFDTGGYLAAAGAVDGSLRLAVFELDGAVRAVDTEPTLVVSSINDVALTVRERDDVYRHTCYAGMENGVSLCLLVRIDLPNRLIDTRQLWRDMHSSPVIGVRPTRPLVREVKDPLYGSDVVFVATQDGHVSIYDTARHDANKPPLAEDWNYRFEGMRFDRIHLPARLTAWAIRNGHSTFVAAYPDGELCFGTLTGSHESKRRAELKARIERIYQQVGHSKLMFGAKATEAEKLEMCEIIRVGGGALRSYVLRKRLEHDLSSGFDAAMYKKLDAQLANLRAEYPEERDRIRAIIEVVSRTVLDRDPDKIVEHYRGGEPYDRDAARLGVKLACQLLTEYFRSIVVDARPGAVRVRIVIMRALLRANLFLHLALDDPDKEGMTSWLREALTDCLRDDNNIVRIETLRATAVALRNISILETRAGNPQLRADFFPRRLETIEWLVKATLDNFARYRRHGEPVLLSTPWTYTTVLVAVIRLFPGQAMGLCERISQCGLGENLDIIVGRLRGDRVRALRDRINGLWIVTCLREPAQARAQFIRAFATCNVDKVVTEHEITRSHTHIDPDYMLAKELLHVYQLLALFWDVHNDADINLRLSTRVRNVGGVPELTGSLTGMSQVLEAFVDLARSEPDLRLAALTNLRDTIASKLRDDHNPPDSVRRVLELVIDHWQAVLAPRVPTTGQHVMGHVLSGRPIADRGNGQVYAVNGSNRMIKVLRYPWDTNARHVFNCGVRLSRELAHRYPDSFVRVYRLDPRYGYAVMEHHEATETREVPHPQLATSDAALRSHVAGVACIQLARALRCLHVEGEAHGDLRAENVFVTRSAGEWKFRLGDLTRYDDRASLPTAELLIPSSLRKPPRRGPKVLDRQWIDLVSLTLFIYWILTRKTLEFDTDRKTLRGVVEDLEQQGRKRGGAVARALARMLGKKPWTTADELERAMASKVRGVRLPKFARQPLMGRPWAKFDVFISYDTKDRAVARDLYERLVERGLLPFFDEREVDSDRWEAHIVGAIRESRSFAVLVRSATYRPGGIHAREADFARSEAGRDLPFNVFLLGEETPPAFLADDPIPVEGGVAGVVDHIVNSFEPAANRVEEP